MNLHSSDSREARRGASRRGRLGTLALVMIAFLSATAGACREDGTEPVPLHAEADALFIGNSLTAANDLPGMVRALSTMIGDTIRTAAVVAGNTSLEDHWYGGGARAALSDGGWDVVVMQQGPSTLEESRQHLIHWSTIFADEIRAHGGAPYLYMVWPPSGGAEARGIESYRRAAEEAGAGLFPVAEAMRIARAQDPSIELLGKDGFHPAPAGTYLAALVIVATLLDRSPVGMPRALPGHVTVTAAEAVVLQESARQAIQALGRLPAS